MKHYLLLGSMFWIIYTTGAQDLYDPEANALGEINEAIEQAANEGKHVMLQIGGNWCRWCKMFDNKVNNVDTLKSVLEENYVMLHVNYSKENKNEEALASLGYPQRFGFPVFVVLDGEGNRLHTQNSAYLEEGDGHSTKKVLSFFRNWSPGALNPDQYK